MSSQKRLKKSPRKLPTSPAAAKPRIDLKGRSRADVATPPVRRVATSPASRLAPTVPTVPTVPMRTAALPTASLRPANHIAPLRPKNHIPRGRLYPLGHHIGGRHVPILPPVVVADDYYWTEEVLINGVYYILYCYPDGTKRFSDGTIFCYF